MRRWIVRLTVLLLAAGAVLTARPAAALEVELVSASVSPAAATRAQPVTVTAKIKRIDPQSSSPPVPVIVEVTFLRVGDANPFAIRRVQLPANATTDVSASWRATTVGPHKFSVSVALAPGQKLPADAKLRGEPRAAAGEVVVASAQQPPQQEPPKQPEGQSKPAATSSSSGGTRPPTPTDAVPPRSSVPEAFKPFVTTAPGIRVAGGPVPTPGAGGASPAPAPFSPVTVTAPPIRVTGGPAPAAGAVRPFSPVTVTAPPITVRGQ